MPDVFLPCLNKDDDDDDDDTRYRALPRESLQRERAFVTNFIDGYL